MRRNTEKLGLDDCSYMIPFQLQEHKYSWKAPGKSTVNSAKYQSKRQPKSSDYNGLHPCRLVIFQIKRQIREIGSYSQGTKSYYQWGQRAGQSGDTYLYPCLGHALSVLLLFLTLYSRKASCRVENLGSFQGKSQGFFWSFWGGEMETQDVHCDFLLSCSLSCKCHKDVISCAIFHNIQVPDEPINILE